MGSPISWEKGELERLMERDKSDYWEKVNEIGEVKLGTATTIKFSRGIRKRDGKEVISIRTWVKGRKYQGPTKQGFDLAVESAKEFDALLKKAIEASTPG